MKMRTLPNGINPHNIQFRISKKYNSKFNFTNDEKSLVVTSDSYDELVTRMADLSPDSSFTRVKSLWAQRATHIACIVVPSGERRTRPKIIGSFVAYKKNTGFDKTVVLNQILMQLRSTNELVDKVLTNQL